MTSDTDLTVAASTRERALTVARELFVVNGYAGTSIADIAERLGVTKAAVYYHFHAKSDLLTELITPMFAQLQAVLDEPHPAPRRLLERVVELLAGHRDIIGMVAGDPSVKHELDACAPIEFFGRLVDALAGPRASGSRRLRARCALGAIHAAVVVPALDHRGGPPGVPPRGVPPRGVPPRGVPPGGAAGPGAFRPPPMTAHERRVVVDAALAALG